MFVPTFASPPVRQQHQLQVFAPIYPTLSFQHRNYNSLREIVLQLDAAMSSLFPSSTTSTATSTSSAGDISKDIAINQPPEDSISDLAFNPQAEILSVASWDNKVRIYDIAENGQSQGKAMISHNKAALSTSFSVVSFLTQHPL